MDKKLLLSIGLIFIVLITQYANCVPVDDTEEPEYLQDGEPEYDDDQDYDEPKKDDSKEVVNTQASTDAYDTENRTEEVELGKSVVLKCHGIFDETAVVMWYNETKLLVQGDWFGPVVKRIQFTKKDGSLRIDNVGAYDDRSYKCRVFPNGARYETNIKLHIKGPPSNIAIEHNHNQDNIIGKTLIYKAGEKDLRFKCVVGTGRPQAKITWIHNGNAIQETKDRDIQLIKDDILEIKVLHAKHAGEYKCEATNDYGSSKESFKVDVQYAPFFRPNHNFFNTEIGYTAEIFCIYKSSPPPTSVKWFRNGNQIHENSKYSIHADMKENHDRTILKIENVEQNDLGIYDCEVQNSLATKRENITVSLVPAPPKFEGFKFINNFLYTDWIVKSHQELQNMVVLYRNNENGWNQSEAKITNQNKIRDGEWKLQGSLSLEPGEWTIVGRAKNSNGWSDDALAKHTTIKIPKDSTESAEMTSSAPSIVSSICGSLIALLISRYFV